MTIREPLQNPPEDSGDDRVIGHALVRSLVLLLVLGMSAAAWWFGTRGTADSPTSQLSVAFPLVMPPAAEPVLLPEPPEIRFADLTRDAGIDFVHENGAAGEMLLPEAMGGGCAFFDFDADGDPDLLFVNSMQRSATNVARAHEPREGIAAATPTMVLYQNDGTGRFRNVTKETGLDLMFDGMGVACGDFDNDGRVDLFLTALGPNRLLRNAGGRFEDVTAAAGVAGAPDAWSTSACWLDYDRDGDLDLFVGNYLAWSADADRALGFRLNGTDRSYAPPDVFEGVQPYLYRNDGEGRFTDVSSTAGIEVWNRESNLPVPKVLGVSLDDVDADGWPDILAACDGVQNLVYRNRRDGTFEEIGARTGLAFDRYGVARRSTGIDAAMVEGGGTAAVVTGRAANEMNALYIARGSRGTYTDEGLATRFGPQTLLDLTFGVIFFDADLDGRLDLMTANGQFQPAFEQLQASQTQSQALRLFWNAEEDRVRFATVPAAKCGDDLVRPMAGRGLATADIDGDGDLDVAISANGGPPRLLRNDQQLHRHWLRVKLRGTTSNRDAIGARVEVIAGNVSQVRTVAPTCGYLSQRELALTFGLGDASRAERLIVTWTGGRTQELRGVAAGQRLEIKEAD